MYQFSVLLCVLFPLGVITVLILHYPQTQGTQGDDMQCTVEKFQYDKAKNVLQHKATIQDASFTWQV